MSKYTAADARLYVDIFRTGFESHLRDQTKHLCKECSSSNFNELNPTEFMDLKKKLAELQAKIEFNDEKIRGVNGRPLKAPPAIPRT